MPFPPRAILAMIFVPLVLSGCGGGGSGEGAGDSGGGSSAISDARACLAKALDGASIQNTTPADKDPKVRSGVFASTTPSASAPGSKATAPTKDFVMAIAAEVKSKRTVAQFQRDSEGLADALAKGGAEKLDVRSGVDGTYVWVVAGAKGAEGLGAANKCVNP